MARIQIVDGGSLRRGRERLERISTEFRSADKEILVEGAKIFVRALKDNAPEGQTGKIKRSIRSRRRGNRLRFLADYRAKFVIEGTKAHPIEPKAKRVLSFTAGGEGILTSHVDHPATRARDFRQAAVDQADPEVAALLRRTGGKVLRTP